MPHPTPPFPGQDQPGIPPRQPTPGGTIPGEQPLPPDPDDVPQPGPNGPRTPYPVDDPPLDPRGPGSEPDYLPGVPTDPGTRF
jgi:hypothetical protein